MSDDRHGRTLTIACKTLLGGRPVNGSRFHATGVATGGLDRPPKAPAFVAPPVRLIATRRSVLASYINSDMTLPMAIKRVTFHGDSLDRLRDFPEDARREAGHELYQVQTGRDPSNWKPMSAIGAGVREIRIRDAVGAYRVIYIATFADAIHVLHVFQKKTQKTARRDLELAAARLRQLKRGSE